MLQTAILRALPAVDAGAIGAEPQHSAVSGDCIGLAVQGRHPETVNDVVGEELDRDGAANGNVQLVGCTDALLWFRMLVFNVPPPLIGGDLDDEPGVVALTGDGAA